MKKYEMISKVSLWALLVIGVIVAVVFFMGGNQAEGYEVAGDILAVPNFTGLFIGWNYILFALSILVTLLFVVLGFVANLKNNKKKALSTLCVLVGFVLLFVVCWALGSGDKINIIGYDGTDNEGFWAHLSDMMMYVCYVLVLGTLGTLLWGVIYTKIKK